MLLVAHVERADRGVKVLREQVEHRAAHQCSARLADHLFGQQTLPGAQPHLLLQHVRLFGLLTQRAVVGGGQAEQFTAAHPCEQAAHAQAEQQEHADQRGGDTARRLGALLAQAQFDIEKIAEFAACFVEFDLAAPARHRGFEILIPATRVDHVFGEAAPALLDRLDLPEPFDLRRIVGDQPLQGFDLRLELRPAGFVRRQKAFVAGDQEAAHRRFTVDREAQHFIGVADHPLGMLGPVHRGDQIRDQADEHRHRDEADTQRQRDVATDDAAKTVLVDGLRCGHFFCLRHNESN